MILYLVDGFGIVTCTVPPLSRLTPRLLPVYHATKNFFMFAVMKTCIIDFSASTRRSDFIFSTWLLHDYLYWVSLFQV